MKLAEHVEHIRQLTDKAFRNRLGRMGLTLKWAENCLKETVETGEFSSLQLPVTDDYINDLKRIIDILNTFEKETGNIKDAYEKLVEELTFTLFNRIAALKVMEAHALHPEIITRQSQHGDRSFSHLYWLEQNPEGRIEENEGLIRFIEDQLNNLSGDISLFSLFHPYHLLPTAIELNGIIDAFNKVETDVQIETDIWKSDDVLGWLYESFNNYKKSAHKESGDKTEYNKVSIQSQVYTPRWVVKFLVDNSLGKLYLEMYPDSSIKEKYKIANAPNSRTREIKPLTEVRMIDLATGSGNFLLYGFDLFYDLYIDQIENYEADLDEHKLPELIISNNLYGIDLDDRAVQLAQLGLYIKAKRKKRSAKISHFNVVSSDFFLPDYKHVKHLFENGEPLSEELEKIVIDLWYDLQQAHKFGSLIRLEEKFNFRLNGLVQEFKKSQLRLFSSESLVIYDQFKENFLSTLKKAVAQNAAKQGVTMLNTKTQDAITFLELLTLKYDVAVANPPYTDSSDFGSILKRYVDANYKEPYKFNANLYASFIKRSTELVNEFGFIGMLHPLTFMYISSFKEVRKFILTKTHIEILNELGLGGVFANSDVQADVVAYVINNHKSEKDSFFLDFKKYKNHANKPDIFKNVYANLINNIQDEHIFKISENSFMNVEDSPFIYWISDIFRNKFKELTIEDEFDVVQGLATANNERFIRFWWEVDQTTISKELGEIKKWYFYSKGGPFDKWYANNWAIVNWEFNGKEIKDYRDEKGKQKSRPQNERYYGRLGITYTRSGSKGASFRIHSENYLFDVGGACVFSKNKSFNHYYLIAYLNSNLSKYILDCLNPTVNTTEGDMKRLPYVMPNKELENQISFLAKANVEIKKNLNSFRIIETNFKHSPFLEFNDNTLSDRLLNYLNFKNKELTKVLLNEAIINKLIFRVFELSSEDQKQVENTMGKSIGDFPVYLIAREDFLRSLESSEKTLIDHISNLPVLEINDHLIKEIKDNIHILKQGNSNLEEFCYKYHMNPINVWYLFKENKKLSENISSEYTLEFFADSFRSLLLSDDDGIIPLVGLPGEPRLLDRFEKYCLNIGFSSAQFIQLDRLIGKAIEEYIEHDFFRLFSDYIKLFKQMPSAPFIWHLSSGIHQGFEAYVIIYKWNRDSLFKLKKYLSNRFNNLEYREIQLQGSESAQAQTEKEKIRLQKLEVEEFAGKIEELIAEGYDPKLDDGVGKNIAPLQKKGMLRCDVLNKKQLEKYLNADW